MTKAKTPQDINLMSRQDIMDLTGITRSRLGILCIEGKYNFPVPAHIGLMKSHQYNKNEVLQWLESNDAATMSICRAGDRERRIQDENRRVSFDNKLAMLFLTKTRHGVFPGLTC
jgi:hypothetical protein